MDGTMRPTTLRDARKMGLLPSVTTVLRSIARPDLEHWKIEQACLAVLTSPLIGDESLDEFVHRVLRVERVQDQEAQKAMDRGTQIHAALENWFSGKPREEIAPELIPLIQPVAEAIVAGGDKALLKETVLVGSGYAGRCDLITLNHGTYTIWDYKTTSSKLPDKVPWNEHRMQLSAYEHAFLRPGFPGSKMKNVYISTTTLGEFKILEHEDTEGRYFRAFMALLNYWQAINDYNPCDIQPTKSE